MSITYICIIYNIYNNAIYLKHMSIYHYYKVNHVSIGI